MSGRSSPCVIFAVVFEITNVFAIVTTIAKTFVISNTTARVTHGIAMSGDPGRDRSIATARAPSHPPTATEANTTPPERAPH